MCRKDPLLLVDGDWPQHPVAADRSGGHLRDEVDAVLAACRVLAATSDVSDLLHLRALVVLGSRMPLSLGELAEAVGSHLTRASRLCDRLVTKGLIHRADEPLNRRQLVLRLTPAGTKIVQTVMRDRARLIRPVLRRTSDEGRATCPRASDGTSGAR